MLRTPPKRTHEDGNSSSEEEEEEAPDRPTKQARTSITLWGSPSIKALVRRHDKEHYYWRMSTKERQTALEEVEKEGLPIYFFFGKHRDAAIPTVMSTPQDETYITKFMAGKPGFFQTCTSKYCDLLKSLYLLGILKEVVDIDDKKVDVVPYIRRIEKQWEKKEEEAKELRERQLKEAEEVEQKRQEYLQKIRENPDILAPL